LPKNIQNILIHNCYFTSNFPFMKLSHYQSVCYFSSAITQRLCRKQLNKKDGKESVIQLNSYHRLMFYPFFFLSLFLF
jgi:hypothetical protein